MKTSLQLRQLGCRQVRLTTKSLRKTVRSASAREALEFTTASDWTFDNPILCNLEGFLNAYEKSFSSRRAFWTVLRGDNYSRINTPELFTVLMQTMDRQTIIMKRVHHVLVVAFHLFM